LRSPTPSFDDSSAMANLQSMSVAEVHPFRARKGNFLRRQCSANLPRKQSPNLQISTSPSPSSGDNSAITKLQFKYVACCHPSCKPEGNISVGNVLRTCRENNLHIFTFPNFQIYTSPTPSFDDSSVRANLQSMSVAEVHPFRARKGNISLAMFCELVIHSISFNLF